MAEAVSLSELARRLGRSKSGLHALAAKGLIPREAGGKFDVAKVESALSRNLDPAHQKPLDRSRTNEQPNERTKQAAVRTPEDAEAAVALIARVLKGEGAVDIGQIDYGTARTADTILKAYERDLKIAQRRKELVPSAQVSQHIAKSFTSYKQAMQRMPSRHVPEMAAALGCDPALLDALMSKAIAAELNGLSAPVVRT